MFPQVREQVYQGYVYEMKLDLNRPSIMRVALGYSPWKVLDQQVRVFQGEGSNEEMIELWNAVVDGRDYPQIKFVARHIRSIKKYNTVQSMVGHDNYFIEITGGSIGRERLRSAVR